MLSIWKSGRAHLIRLFLPTMPLPLKCLGYRSLLAAISSHFSYLRTGASLLWRVNLGRIRQPMSTLVLLARVSDSGRDMCSCCLFQLPPHSLRLKLTSDTSKPFLTLQTDSSLPFEGHSHIVTTMLRPQVPALTQVYTNSYVHESLSLLWGSFEISPIHCHATCTQSDTCHVVGTNGG